MQSNHVRCFAVLFPTRIKAAPFVAVRPLDEYRRDYTLPVVITDPATM